MRTLRGSHTPSALPTGTTLDVVPALRRDRPGGVPIRRRLKAYVTRGRLDRQIAARQPCDTTADLTLRARQLADPHTQHEIARNLRGVLRYVDRSELRRAISSVVIEPRAVRIGRHAIVELAEQLERAAPVNPRGVVLAQLLLTDGRSPLFDPWSETTVTEAVREVQAALEEPPTIALNLA